MFMEFMNDDTDEQIVRLLYEYQAQEEAASSNRPRRPRRNIERNREEGHDQLFNDYFSEAPVYTNEQFRR
ncbi:ribosomal protein, partial [Trifolium medium]|nr:ribosomal protein [Trifolium medium]